MSKASDAPWHSNPTNPPNGGSGSEEVGSGEGDANGSGERPSVKELTDRFEQEYPGRAYLPLSETDGREIRRSLTETDRVEYEAPLKYGEGTVERTYTAKREAVTWAAAVDRLLESYREDEQSRMRMARGAEGSPEREEFTVPLENSFMPSYQEGEYAELKALERETVGFSTCDEDGCRYYCKEPDDHETEWVSGEYEEPCLALVTLTASSTPDGDRLTPVEHTDARRGTWGGRDGVRRKLRDVMDRELGLEPDEWVFWRQCAVHPGDGENACYGHDHVFVVFDRAAAGDGTGEADAKSGLRSVVDRHVERCEYAGAEAHREGAVEVKTVQGDGEGEVGSMASYVSEYLSVDPDEGLFERSTEYIAWAAQLWATNRQKRSKSNSAGRAIDADACKQQYRDGETNQDHDHGEEVRYDDGPGPDVVCAACGSGWGIEQTDTVTAARVDREGEESGGLDAAKREAEAELRDRWPEAEAAAEVPDGLVFELDRWPEAEEAVGVADGVVPEFEYPPRWKAEAVVRGEGEDAEEYPIRGGGPDMVELKLPECDGQRLWDRPEGAVFRCHDCLFSTYQAETMQRHVTDHGEDAEDLVYHHFHESGDETGGETGAGDTCARCGEEGVCYSLAGVATCRGCRRKITDGEMPVTPQD